MIDTVDEERQALDPKLKAILSPDEEEAKGYLYCAKCSHVIGRADDRIEVNGAFQHRLTNPAGITFDLGCYRDALGSTIAGERQAADSWFAGYLWRYASCAACGEHLGWYFDTSDHFFYGLILDRVQSD